MKKRQFLPLVIAAACLMWPLPGKKAGTEIPFEADGGTILEDPELCANQFCHSVESTLNDPTRGSVSFQNLPESYVPGESYDLGVEIVGKQFVPGNQRTFGLQLATILAGDTQAGLLQPMTAGTTTLPVEGVSFLTHQQPLPSGQVAFRWTAPGSGSGAVTIRVAANATNNDGTERGDAISTLQAVIPEGSPPPESVFYFAQVGVGTSEVSTFDTDLIFVNTGEATTLLAQVFESSGNPMMLSLEPSQGETQVGSEIEMDLPRGSSRTLQLRGLGEISAGYVKVTTGPDVGGVAVFSFLVDFLDGSPLRRLFDSGVPSSTLTQDFSLSAEVVSGVSDTGLALVNPAEAGVPSPTGQAEIQISLYSEDFELLQTTNLPLAAGEHTARFLSELFSQLQGPEVVFSGSVTVHSDTPVAAVTLRQTTVPTLTALPVIPGRADESTGN